MNSLDKRKVSEPDTIYHQSPNKAKIEMTLSSFDFEEMNNLRERLSPQKQEE